AAPATKAPVRVAPNRQSALRPIASTRMAIQMATALAASFVVGHVVFGHRWAWIVLTAFIVISGNRGRLDVAYKSLLRVMGAAGGTIVALSIDFHAGAHNLGIGALIMMAVFIGTWLRPLNYVWWALFVTIALALLQGFADAPAGQLLFLRLQEIVIGAFIGVVSAWFILPVRSTGVLRRRIADALAVLGAALDPANDERTPEEFVAAVGSVEQLAPAFRASRWITRRLPNPGSSHPADWIDLLVACARPGIALIEDRPAPADVRRAVGAARKAMLDVSTLLPALHDLRQVLTRAATPAPADAASTSATLDDDGQCKAQD
ncbi:MAG TPA: FUSC family protein, partial [Rudaea sp.]|nr:FUSC family protein [Rudaea sp.]